MRDSLLMLAIFIIFSQISHSGEPIRLHLDRNQSAEGFLTISWDDTNNSTPVALQISDHPTFNHLLKDISLTNQNAVHLSGFNNGTYYVRLHENKQQISSSDIAQFNVRHRQLDEAITLFILGLSLFVFLVFTLYRFNRHPQD